MKKKMGFLGGFMRRGELHPGLGKSKSIVLASKGVLEGAHFNRPTGFLGLRGDVPFCIPPCHHIIYPEASGETS